MGKVGREGRGYGERSIPSEIQDEITSNESARMIHVDLYSLNKNHRPHYYNLHIIYILTVAERLSSALHNEAMEE